MSYYIGDETVNGTIIGTQYRRYQFWTVPTEKYPAKPITDMLYFEHDREAIEWFKMHHAPYYKQGAEMRTWD